MERKYIVFNFNHEKCALEVEDVLEIVSLDSLYKTTEGEISVLDWNGQAIPVIDPYTLLTVRYHKPTVNSKVVVVEKRDKKFGILFDGAGEVLEVDDEDIEEPRLNEPRYVKGVIKGFVKLFEPESLLKKELVEKFEQVYELEISVLNEPIKYYEKEMNIEREVSESAKMKILNLLVSATRDKLDEKYINEIVDIQKMITVN